MAMRHPSLDPNALLQQAYQAFQTDSLEKARDRLRQLISAYPATVTAHHLLALVERKAGNAGAARSAFEAALRLTPNDPQILNNFANFLAALGEWERAFEYYGNALRLIPDFIDAWINLGLAHQRLGRFAEAREALEQAARLRPDQVRPWLTLGLLHREAGGLDEAAEALDKALALNPNHARALHARARVENERGDAPKSLTFYNRARAVSPLDVDLAIGEALARHDIGDSEGACADLEYVIAGNPGHIEAHAALARLRWQLGDNSGSTEGYRGALAARPSDARLWANYLNLLMRIGRHEEVATEAARARALAGSRSEFDLIDAIAASEQGDIQRADSLFDQLAALDDVDIGLARTRHLLKARRTEAAAWQAEALTERNRAPMAWAYLATAWRMLDDPRWAWLEGDPRFVGTADLCDIADVLPRLADLLRGLHLAKTHPLDQTLRGGTQTNGALFKRAEPEIRQLKAAIERAVADHIAQLPPADPRHPLLRQPRDGFRIVGSWSVRLTAQGFHINHVHPEGWISSAFYVSLPSEIQEQSPAGWLTLGAPPVELGLDLAPFRTVEPKPGRLVLFPSTMWHGTIPFTNGERLTVAFDIASA